MRCSSCSAEVKPIVAVDIDGTLGDYHMHFIRFAERWLGHRLPANYRGDVEFSDHLGLEKSVYREIKLAYRQGGMKRSMPPMNGAISFMQRMNDLGLEVWVTTTRPHLRLDNIDPDTRFWLSNNNISYAGLLFNEDKYEQLLRIVDRERVIAVVDDQTNHLINAHNVGLRAVQRRSKWNANARWQPGSGDLHEIGDWIEGWLHQWEREHGIYV